MNRCKVEHDIACAARDSLRARRKALGCDLTPKQLKGVEKNIANWAKLRFTLHEVPTVRILDARQATILVENVVGDFAVVGKVHTPTWFPLAA